MKNNKILILAFLLVGIMSCDDFEDLNQNPTVSNNINPNMQLTYAISTQFSSLNTYKTATCYLGPFTQQICGSWESSYYGGRFFKEDQNGASLVWQAMYPDQVKNIVDLVDRTIDVPEYNNLNAMARIFKVFLFSTLTDTWGDIPYFDAGKGYISGDIRPRYDKQEDIYTDFFNELDEAVKQFDNESLPATGDVVYNGNINKWKKLANSLRLRLGLRVIKVAPDLAKQQVQAAISDPAGVFNNSEDDAVVQMMNFTDRSDDRKNALAGLLNGFGGKDPLYCVCSTLFNYMEQTQDPRKFIYGRCYSWVSRPNMPVGTDITDLLLSISTPEIKYYAVKGRGAAYWDQPYGSYWGIPDTVLSGGHYYEETALAVNKKFRTWDMPGEIISYAETEFLLAEALFRWPDIGIGGTVDGHYQKGIRASMKYLERYNIDKIPESTVTEFVTNNELIEGRELEQINYQLWVLHFTNYTEAYANWRRSGYPELEFGIDSWSTPIDAQSIPRRMFYPVFENLDNSENLQEAISRMGGTDNWEDRVWWDKE